MTQPFSGRKASLWGALAAIVLFNLVCFGLVNASRYAHQIGEVEVLPVESKTAKRTPAFARITEMVLGQ